MTPPRVLEEVDEELRDRGIAPILTEPRMQVRSMLKLTGLDERFGAARVFPTMEAAVDSVTATERP